MHRRRSRSAQQKLAQPPLSNATRNVRRRPDARLRHRRRVQGPLVLVRGRREHRRDSEGDRQGAAPEVAARRRLQRRRAAQAVRHGDAGGEEAAAPVGDDAAAGANLLAEVNGSLWFMGDAIADPITGATAATLVLGYWLGCSSALLDLGLSPTAALYSQGLLSRASSF